MENFDQFMNGWLSKPFNQRCVDFDHVFKYQCVDLILDGLYQIDGITGVSGNAIDYWFKPSPNLSKGYYRVNTNAPERGDAVVLYTLGHIGENYGDGHIGWGTGGLNATQFELFEQNGGGGGTGQPKANGQHGDEIGTRWIDRSRIAGVWRRIPVAVPVAAPAAVVSPFTIEAITPKQVTLNKTCNEWGMHYDNFTAINNNPVKRDVPAGTPLTVVAICHHAIGENYYLENADVASGYNVKDCTDVPTTPTIPVPNDVSKTTGATPFPSPKEPYEVLVPIPGYITSNAAINHLNATVPAVAVGDYFVFAKRLQDENDPTSKVLAYNITHVEGQSYAWINPDDNVVPPEPEPEPEPEVPISDNWIGPRDSTVEATPEAEAPAVISTSWKDTREFFYENHNKFDLYIPNANIVVKNYDGKTDDLPLPAGHKIPVYGTFDNPAGVKCYLLRINQDVNVSDPVYGNVTIAKDTTFSYFYGVPVTNPDQPGMAFMTKYVPPAPAPLPAPTSVRPVVMTAAKNDLTLIDRVNDYISRADKVWDIIVVHVKAVRKEIKGVKK